MSEEKIIKRFCIFHIDCPKKDDCKHAQYFICEYQKFCRYGLNCKQIKPGRKWSQEDADTHNRFFKHDKHPNRESRRAHMQKIVVKEKETHKVTWTYQIIGIDVYEALYNIDSMIDSVELYTIPNMKTKMIKHLISKHANGNAFTQFKIDITCSLENS